MSINNRLTVYGGIFKFSKPISTRFRRDDFETIIIKIGLTSNLVSRQMIHFGFTIFLLN